MGQFLSKRSLLRREVSPFPLCRGRRIFPLRGRAFFRRTLFVFLFTPFPFRYIVKDAALAQLPIRRQLLQRDFIELCRLIVVEHHDALALIQACKFVRLNEISLDVAACLRIGTGGIINRGEQRSERVLVVGNRNRDLAALFSEVFGAGHIVAAHIERHIKGAELIFPLLPRILFLPLGK